MAKQGGSSFGRVPQKEWVLSHQMTLRQKRRLRRQTTYEQIIARLARGVALHDHTREGAHSKGGGRFFRTHVTLRVDTATVDLFHNSPSGYRAQYYLSAKNGDRANTYALRQLVPRIRQLLIGHAKRTCPWSWVEKSLLDPSAKVWIYQGRWWRHAKRKDRHLAVRRWVAEQTSPEKMRRRKAAWGALTPDRETRVDVKGGFTTLAGVPLGSLKLERAKDINELGFT